MVVGLTQFQENTGEMPTSDETVRQEEQELFDRTRRFRAATDPNETERLGNVLGRTVFGGDAEELCHTVRRFRSSSTVTARIMTPPITACCK
jgi:hypothetical protein